MHLEQVGLQQGQYDKASKAWLSQTGCLAESFALLPSAHGASPVFEARRQQAKQERIVILETLLILQSDGGAVLPAEDWLRLASSVGGALYARGPAHDTGQGKLLARAQQLVRKTHSHPSRLWVLGLLSSGAWALVELQIDHVLQRGCLCGACEMHNTILLQGRFVSSAGHPAAQ